MKKKFIDDLKLSVSNNLENITMELQKSANQAKKYKANFDQNSSSALFDSQSDDAESYMEELLKKEKSYLEQIDQDLFHNEEKKKEFEKQLADVQALEEKLTNEIANQKSKSDKAEQQLRDCQMQLEKLKQAKFDLESNMKEQQRKLTECADKIQAYQNTLEDKLAGREKTNFEI